MNNQIPPISGGEEPSGFYGDEIGGGGGPIGGPPDDHNEMEDRGSLANYFTSTLESSFISRRGRPPVIRAAEKVSS